MDRIPVGFAWDTKRNVCVPGSGGVVIFIGRILTGEVNGGVFVWVAPGTAAGFVEPLDETALL